MALARETPGRGAKPGFARVASYLLAGPLNWAIQFGVLYLLHTLACAEATAAAIGPIFPIVVAIVAILSAGLSILAILYARLLERALNVSELPQAETYRRISSALHALAVAAIAWSTIASYLVDRCALVVV
jgi:putative flippase GtrA